MSKFCGNCGTQLPDDANVCGNCGCNLAPAAAPAQEATPGDNVMSAVKDKTNAFVGKMKSDKKFMGLVLGIAGGVVALIVLIIVLVAVFGGGYKKAIDNYIDAYFYGDYDAYLDTRPDDYWDEHDPMDEDDFEESIELANEFREEEYGKDIKVSFEVVDEDELDEDELKELKDELKDDWGVAKRDVTEAYEIEVETTIEGDDDEDTDETEMLVVKIDGDWYVVN